MLDTTTPIALRIVETNWLFCKFSLFILSYADKSMTKGAIRIDLIKILLPSLGTVIVFQEATEVFK